MRGKGKRIKQINNLTIYWNPEQGLQGYKVYTPDGRCWEDNLFLRQAEYYCKNTTDFIRRK